MSTSHAQKHRHMVEVEHHHLHCLYLLKMDINLLLNYFLLTKLMSTRLERLKVPLRYMYLAKMGMLILRSCFL